MPYIGIYILCFAVPPLLIFSLYFLKRDYLHWRRYTWLYALLIGLFAYSYVPVSGDLSRYLQRLDRYSYYTLKQAIETYYWLDAGEVAWNWIISKSGIPGLLSGIPQFVIMLIASYITCDYLEKKNAKESIYKAIIIQFLILPEISTINNVFCVSAFALFSLAAYRDLMQKKRNVWTFALYIIACLIHSSAIILVALRLAAIFIKRAKYAAIVLVFLLPILLNTLHSNAFLFRNYQVVYKLIESGYQYYSETEGNPAYTVSRLYLISFVHNMLFSFLSLYLVLRVSRKNEDTNNNRAENTFSTFLLLVSVLAISCVIFNAPHYWRFNFIVKLCAAVLLFFAEEDWHFGRICTYLFVLDGLMVKLVETIDFTRIADVGKTFENFLFSSPFGIIAKVFMGLF